MHRRLSSELMRQWYFGAKHANYNYPANHQAVDNIDAIIPGT